MIQHFHHGRRTVRGLENGGKKKTPPTVEKKLGARAHVKSSAVSPNYIGGTIFQTLTPLLEKE